jgi:hypothetical protein
VHDVFYDEEPKTATWQAVHRMFYNAMMASGVDKERALVMYRAVYRFGPKWPDPSLFLPANACRTVDGKTVCVAPPPPPPPPTPTEEDVRQIEQLV